MDLNDHVHGEPVVFCKNPECPEPLPNHVRLPLRNPPRIGEHRETTPLDNRNINYICRTCGQLSVFGKDDVRWLPTIDTEQDLSVPYTALWKIRYVCGVENCGDRVEVFVYAESDYKDDDVVSFLLHAKQFPACSNGHTDLDGADVIFVGIALTL